MEILGINWNIEKRKVADLKLWDKNPRKISKDAFNKLKQRIIDRGMHDVLKIDVDNTVLSGNQRKQVLQELGIEEVFVMLPERELTSVERDKVALESNRNDGADDFDLMSNFDHDLLRDIGFTDEELVVGFGLNKADGQLLDLDRLAVIQVDPPEAPELKERMIIKFESFTEFTRVKEAILLGKINAKTLVGLL